MRLPPRLLERWVGQLASRRRSDPDLAMKEYWAAHSARFRERHHGHLGLAYGERPRERLDLFLARDPAAPTLAYIHGGYWQMTHQTKELYSGRYPAG
jgi:hypothetical protein